MFVILGALLGTSSRGDAQPEQQTPNLVLCTPNGAGSREAARPVLEQLEAYLSRAAGQPLAAIYFNQLTAAERWLEGARPRYGILSLDVYLRWRGSRPLLSLACVARAKQTTERYFLLVPASAPEEGLERIQRRGQRLNLWSPHLDDARFAFKVVFGGALSKESVLLLSCDQPLRVARRMIAGEPYQGQGVDAVLVNTAEWGGFQRLSRFKGKLKVIHRSPLLPGPQAVVFGETLSSEDETLQRALLSMADDPQASPLLSSLRVTGFGPPQTAALEQVVQAYEEDAP